MSWEKKLAGEIGDDPIQPHPGTQLYCYRCFLPDLAGFTANCREGTKLGHHYKLSKKEAAHYRNLISVCKRSTQFISFIFELIPEQK